MFLQLSRFSQKVFPFEYFFPFAKKIPTLVLYFEHSLHENSCKRGQCYWNKDRTANYRSEMNFCLFIGSFLFLPTVCCREFLQRISISRYCWGVCHTFFPPLWELQKFSGQTNWLLHCSVGGFCVAFVWKCYCSWSFMLNQQTSVVPALFSAPFAYFFPDSTVVLKGS